MSSGDYVFKNVEWARGGHPLVKRRMLEALILGPMTASELCSLLELPSVKTTRVHLCQLAAAGYVYRGRAANSNGRRIVLWSIHELEIPDCPSEDPVEERFESVHSDGPADDLPGTPCSLGRLSDDLPAHKDDRFRGSGSALRRILRNRELRLLRKERIDRGELRPGRFGYAGALQLLERDSWGDGAEHGKDADGNAEEKETR